MSEQTKSHKPEISIVIPVYNERENLILLDEEITKHMQPLNKKYEVLLVDDGSTDGSAEIIRTLQGDNPHLRLIRFGHNHGQTAAFSAGFIKAHGDIIVTMDADLQNSPADIHLLLDAIKIMMLCAVGDINETIRGSEKFHQKSQTLCATH